MIKRVTDSILSRKGTPPVLHPFSRGENRVGHAIPRLLMGFQLCRNNSQPGVCVLGRVAALPGTIMVPRRCQAPTIPQLPGSLIHYLLQAGGVWPSESLCLRLGKPKRGMIIFLPWEPKPLTHKEASHTKDGILSCSPGRSPSARGLFRAAEHPNYGPGWGAPRGVGPAEEPSYTQRLELAPKAVPA